MVVLRVLEGMCARPQGAAAAMASKATSVLGDAEATGDGEADVLKHAATMLMEAKPHGKQAAAALNLLRTLAEQSLNACTSMRDGGLIERAVELRAGRAGGCTGG